MKFWRHKDFGDFVIIDSNNSMGLVRYILAFAVVVAHFNTIFNTEIFFPISSFSAVGGFFALSGFLLYGSYMRKPVLKDYIRKRARRLLPPYIFIVLSCALFLVFASLYSWEEYFFNPEWIQYLAANLSFLNFLQPDLPGVFTSSPVAAVNGSLWTMKVEIMLYATIPFVLFLSIKAYQRYKRITPIIIFILIYVLSCIYRVIFSYAYEQTGREIYNILGRQFIGQLMYFYSGVFLYFVWNKIKRRLLIILPLAMIIYFFINDYHYLRLTLSPILLSYIVIGISSFGGILSKLNFNNISYDIYLFHFPILQLFFQYRYFFLNNTPLIFALSLASIIILSLFSWFVIEKRFLPKKFV